MKFKTIIPYVIMAVMAVLLLMECNRDPEVIKVTVPAKEGKFEPQKPVYITETDTVYITRWKEKEIFTENPVNDSLAIAYQEVRDSLSRYKMYLDAIQIRKFENVFEDEFVKLTLRGEVQGELRYIRPEYVIKEREIDVEVPEPPNRFLLGGEFGGNTSFSDFRYKLNAGLQTKNGAIYRLGYARESFQNVIWVGYDFSVWEF